MTRTALTGALDRTVDLGSRIADARHIHVPLPRHSPEGCHDSFGAFALVTEDPLDPMKRSPAVAALSQWSSVSSACSAGSSSAYFSSAVGTPKTATPETPRSISRHDQEAGVAPDILRTFSPVVARFE